MLLAAETVFLSSPFLAPVLTIFLCAMAGVGTWLMMPKTGKSSFVRHIGSGMGAVALACFALLLIRWATLGSAATTIYFWLFAVLAIGAAAKVITHPLPVYSSLYFVLAAFSSAGLLVLVWAEFIAAALVLIYAGAVLITYTFVIMLASEASGQGLVSKLAGGTAEGQPYDTDARSPLMASIAGFVTLGVMLFVLFDKSQAIEKSIIANPDAPTGLQGLAVYLFTNQLVSVQIAGLILTLAMVGAILIARRKLLVSDEERLTPIEPQPISSLAAPADDNPHSVPVEGKPGPRARREEAEMLEL
jgi:NADH-quinone oxidoreductase subunit J